MPGGPNSSTPFGILAPRAWYFAGFCRKSLISYSSSTASSAPATSAKVVFGVSLVIIFALDLPKLSTREPPPCICDMKNSSRSTSSAIGSRLTSRLTQMLSDETLASAGPVTRLFALASSTSFQIWSPAWYGNCASILLVSVLPNLVFWARSSWSVCSLSWKTTLLILAVCS